MARIRNSKNNDGTSNRLRALFRSIMSEVTESGGSEGTYRDNYLDAVSASIKKGKLSDFELEWLARRAASLEWNRDERNAVNPTSSSGFFVTRVGNLDFPNVIFYRDGSGRNRRVFTRYATLAQLQGQIDLVRDHYHKVGEKLEQYWEPRLLAVLSFAKSPNDKISKGLRSLPTK